MSKTNLLAILLLGSLATAGCSPISAAKMGYTVIRGAQAEVIVIDSPPAGAEYADEIKVGQVTTDVGHICGPEVIEKSRQALNKVLMPQVKSYYTGGDEALRLETVCRFYKQKSLIGSEGRLDWLVRIVDDTSGTTLARVYVEGLTKSPVHTEIKDMANENAKELAKYLLELPKGEVDTAAQETNDS